MNNLKLFALCLGAGMLLGGCAAPPVALPVTEVQVQALPAGLSVGQTLSLRVATPGYTNRTLRHQGSLGYTSVIDAASSEADRRSASWKVVAGLADAACISLQSLTVPIQYLRHQNSRLRLGSGADALFKADATFCPRAGLDGGATVSLAAKNFPGSYVRHRNGEVWLDALGGSTQFRQDASWTPGAALYQPPAAVAPDLSEPRLKDIAMQLVSSAENSTLDWKAQYGYIEDIGDGRGYTGGIIGFTSGTSDMLALVQTYTDRVPGNVLARYLSALRAVDGSASHAGLDPNYPADWRRAATDPLFRAAQDDERDRVYFNPSVADAKTDGLRALGQFAYYDAAVVHGYSGMQSIRRRALARAGAPAQGGSEVTYLNAFLDERVIEMKKEAAHDDVSRIETAQRVFLRNGNLDLNTPLNWKVYGDSFSIQ